MEQLISYFETIPSLHRSLILVGGITFFWILEGIVPLFNVPYKKWRHSVPNFFFTLTTIIVNFPLAFLLLKSSDLTESERHAYLKIAHENAKRLSTMVEELFELAKLDANEVRPQQELFSLGELAFDVSQKFHLRASEKNIELKIVVDETVPYVSADVGMIERVLDNLIDNSLKHTPEGGCVRMQLTTEQGEAKIAISDTGYGIAEEEIPHIFNRFYRKSDAIENTSEDKLEDESAHSGLGLGLAIASRIVELHGSRLSVNSVLHQGTTFQFSLPVPG